MGTAWVIFTDGCCRRLPGRVVNLWTRVKRVISIGGSKWGRRGRVPPGGPNSFIFMQFSAKNLQNNPNLGVGAPPRENPGSATDQSCTIPARGRSGV